MVGGVELRTSGLEAAASNDDGVRAGAESCTGDHLGKSAQGSIGVVEGGGRRTLAVVRSGDGMSWTADAGLKLA